MHFDMPLTIQDGRPGFPTAAQLSVFMYVETFYNSVRLHQTLGH